MAGTGNTVERQCGTELTTLPAGNNSLYFHRLLCVFILPAVSGPHSCCWQMRMQIR
jgi:hypothetical protein